MQADCRYVMPQESDVEVGAKDLKAVIKGMVSPGNFWFMTKLSRDMEDRLKLKLPSLAEMRKALKVVMRFSHTEAVYKSNTIIDVINMSLKSPKLNRDYLRDIQSINFMNKGDLFLE